MKGTAFLIILCFLVASSLAAGDLSVKWLSLEEGMAKARAEKKPMIVDFFFGKGCPRCEVLQKEVYDNPAIARKIMDDFIPIRIDLTRKLNAEEERLGNQYDYKNDCLLLFLDYNGVVIKDPSGKKFCFADNIDPEWFVKYLEMVKKQ